MRAVDTRLSKLEQRFGIARTTPRYLIILNHRLDDPELGPGPAGDTYIKILDEAGFLPTAGFGMVDLDRIPRGLSAKEAERFVRENGAEICSRRGAQNPGGPRFESDQERPARSVVIELEEPRAARGHQSMTAETRSQELR
jgi:hypothetical protein